MQETIKVIIVEDEEIWLKSLELHLTDLGIDLIGTASDSDTALSLLANEAYDIALLDINLNGKNTGIELGKMVQNVYKKPFIFITGSHDSHTLNQAVLAKPSAYLLKPANKISLLVAIQNAIQNHQHNILPTPSKSNEVNDFVFVKAGKKYKKINWNEVLSLTSEGNYTKLFSAVDGKEYFIRSTIPNTLKYYIPESIKQKFIQLNRAEMVNIDYIQEVSADFVVTKFNKIAFSESNGKELKKRLNILS